jgi:hypothetical protein
MDGNQLAASVVQSLVWPGLLALAFWVFQKDIPDLLRRLLDVLKILAERFQRASWSSEGGQIDMLRELRDGLRDVRTEVREEVREARITRKETLDLLKLVVEANLSGEAKVSADGEVRQPEAGDP